MKKLQKIATLFLISALFIVLLTCYAPVSAEIKYKVCGYVVDAEGNALVGADVIFCVPDIVPGCFTNASGYYEMIAPAGTYHLLVWPPYNSSYINYDEPSFVVTQDLSKNITLQVGCKVSGYIQTNSGEPIKGAGVYIGNYGSGYGSNAQGYYYITVPAGTYSLLCQRWASTCPDFPKYTENNLVINGALTKNITVGSTTINPTPTSTSAPTQSTAKYTISGYILNADGNPLAGADIIFNVPNIVPGCITDASGYYELNAPAGTYHVNVWPPYNTSYINYDEPNLTVTGDITKNITLQRGYMVSGYLTDANGAPMVGAVVAFDNYCSGWFTNSQGYYFLSVPAGTYRIDAHPRVGTYQNPTSQFQTYIENNFQVTSNTIKNITVNSQAASSSNPASQSSSTTSTQQTSPNTPTPTPQSLNANIQAESDTYNAEAITQTDIIPSAENIASFDLSIPLVILAVVIFAVIGLLTIKYRRR